MAVAGSNLTAAYDGVDRTAYTTASITPTANALILAAVENGVSGAPPTAALSGNGLTWVEVGNVVYDATGTQHKLTVFRALGASPSAGVVTIDYGAATMVDCAWSIDEFTGVDTSGTNGSGAVVQYQVNNASNTTLTVTLGAFSDAGNGTYGAFAHQANEVTAFGTGFTELGDVQGSAPNAALQTEWRADNDTSVDASWVTSTLCGGLAIEIKVAAAVAASAAQVPYRMLMGIGL